MRIAKGNGLPRAMIASRSALHVYKLLARVSVCGSLLLEDDLWDWQLWTYLTFSLNNVLPCTSSHFCSIAAN